MIVSNWYKISKQGIPEQFLDAYRNALTIRPRSGTEVAPPMFIFSEDKDYFYAPAYWGMVNFGQPIRETVKGHNAVYTTFPDPTHRLAPQGQAEFMQDLLRACSTHKWFSAQGGTGTGKCHTKGTRVIMYDGTVKNVEDVAIGDILMGDDSTPRMVLSLASGQDELYKIVPTTGEEFGINANHILSLQVTGSKRGVIDNNGNKYSAGEKFDIQFSDYLKCSKKFKHMVKLYRPSFVNFSGDSELLIPPYILGCWLGDGSSRTVSITSMDDEIVSSWVSYSYTHSNHYVRTEYLAGNKANTYHIHGYDGNMFNVDFNYYSLFRNKHIPIQYKRSSIDERLLLLAGLIDTDGYLSGNVFEIVQKNEKLTDDIIFTARSVGFSVSKSIKVINGVNYYRVFLSGDVSRIPVKLNRKKAGERKQVKNVLVTGFKYESIGNGEYYGFVLDGNHRYLLKDFTVTHNTVCGLHTIARLGKEGMIVVPTDRLVRQWKEQAIDKLGLTEDQIGIVKQDTCEYKGKHIVIASMQSLMCHEYDPEFYTYHGVIIYDEAHTLAAQQMSSIFGKFSADIQIAMSATLKRRDGRGRVLELWFGEPTVVAKTMQPAPIVITPFEYRHEPYIGIEDRNEAIAYLGRNQKRNEKLSSIIYQLYSKGRVVLGIGDSVKQLQSIYEMLVKSGVNTDEICIFADQLYTGQKRLSIRIFDKLDIDILKENKGYIESKFGVTFRPTITSISISGKPVKNSGVRAKLFAELARLTSLHSINFQSNATLLDDKVKVTTDDIDEMLSNQGMKIYLSTYGVMKMGVDVPWLDVGIDLTPRVEGIQVIGRVRRIREGKPLARWYTPIDTGISNVIDNINRLRINDYRTSPNLQINDIRRK